MTFTIDDLIGRPYLKDGRGPDSYDCYGLCIEVSRRAGIIVPEGQTPPTRAGRNKIFTSAKDVWQKLSKPEPFCFAAFHVRGNWHAGIVLPGLTSFIHITAGIRVTVSQLNSLKWRQLFDGFYIFPNP